MELHGTFSPSKLPRIVLCPGSVQLTKDLARESSSYAQEGTRLHGAVELSLTNDEFKVTPALIKQFSLEEKELQEAVQDALDWVLTTRMQFDGQKFQEGIESRVSLSGYQSEELVCPELQDVFGTLDYSLYIPGEKLLVCADWKFGRNIEVFADTEQLKAYALGRIKNVSNLLHKVDRIQCTIIQPRLYSGDHEKTVTYSSLELYEWLKNDLVPALREAVSRNPTFHPSEKACMWCEARKQNICKARHQLNVEAAQQVFAAFTKMPDKISKDELSELMMKFKSLEQYMKDMMDFAAAQIQKGLGFPGWKMVHGRSIRQWKNSEETTVPLLEKLGIETMDCYKDPEFKSPTQVEKLVGRKVSNLPEFKELIIKPEGKPTLVPDDDKRPAIDFASPEETFAEFVEEV
jgi:hypothetical protein